MELLRSVRASRRARVAAVAAFTLPVALAAWVGARPSRRGVGAHWYRTLHKPAFQPPGGWFGPVWTVLYGLMATSGVRVYGRRPSRARTRALRLWTAQLGLNALWPHLFFGRQRPGLALADSALLLATTLAYVRAAKEVDSKAAALFLPYVGWLAFATLLNEEIVRRNAAPETTP